jgi:hypothetical protein
MTYKITRRRNGKILTEYELALEIYKAGQVIIYCDIEGIAEINGTYYILDECGNWAYIDNKIYQVERFKDRGEE